MESVFTPVLFTYLLIQEAILIPYYEIYEVYDRASTKLKTIENIKLHIST
jgi:hypothetical protein